MAASETPAKRKLFMSCPQAVATGALERSCDTHFTWDRCSFGEPRKSIRFAAPFHWKKIARTSLPRLSAYVFINWLLRCY